MEWVSGRTTKPRNQKKQRKKRRRRVERKARKACRKCPRQAAKRVHDGRPQRHGGTEAPRSDSTSQRLTRRAPPRSGGTASALRLRGVGLFVAFVAFRGFRGFSGPSWSLVPLCPLCPHAFFCR